MQLESLIEIDNLEAVNRGPVWLIYTKLGFQFLRYLNHQFYFSRVRVVFRFMGFQLYVHQSRATPQWWLLFITTLIMHFSFFSNRIFSLFCFTLWFTFQLHVCLHPFIITLWLITSINWLLMFHSFFFVKMLYKLM